MKMNSGPPDSSADEQASLWAARLDGSTLSTSDREALDAWLAADPSHRTLLSQYCQFSADLEEQLPSVVAAGRVEMPATRAKTTKPYVLFATFATVALAAAAAVTFIVRAPKPSAPLETIATSVGKRETRVLADGTRVELNAQTSIAIETSKNERRVRLGSGEAFFSVNKDPARPFIVETPAGSVRVTGTKFNVHTELSSALDVTVLEGSVQVRPGETAGTSATAPVTLAPGDQLTAASGNVSVKALSPSELDDALAWREGQIVFDRVLLSEALRRFARYHGRGISASPEAASLSVSGRYSLDDLDGFFYAIEQFLPVKVSADLSGTVRVNLRRTDAPAAP